MEKTERDIDKKQSKQGMNTGSNQKRAQNTDAKGLVDPRDSSSSGGLSGGPEQPRKPLNDSK